MSTFRTIASMTLAVALACGGTGIAFAAQSTSASGESGVTKAGEAVSDTWITTKVKTELGTTKGVKSTDISVHTKDGVVTLTGVLATRDAVRKAVAAAESVKGVKDVDSSGLKVKGSSD